MSPKASKLDPGDGEWPHLTLVVGSVAIEPSRDEHYLLRVSFCLLCHGV